MHHRWDIGMARAAGFGTLAIGGLLLAQGRLADAQGREGGNAQDTQMLIAHGLEMAIEGSTLQGLAMQAGFSGAVGSATGGVRSGASDTSTSGGAGGTSGTAGTAGTGTSGTATAGGTSGASGAGSTDAVRTAGGGTGTSTVSMMGGQSTMQLQRHAQRSFEASRRLLEQSAQGGADQRFQKAAARYAATLMSFGNGTGGRGDAGVGGPGAGTPGPRSEVSGAPTTSVPGSGGAASGSAIGGSLGASTAPGGMSGGVDQGSIALINHGVKEALGSMKIKQMVRLMGSSESPSAQLLLTHAREMDAESRSAIQPFLAGSSGEASGAGAGGASGSGAGRASGSGASSTSTSGAGRASGSGAGAGSGAASGGGAGGSGVVGGPVQTLAVQAQELVQAIQGLSGLSNR